jgi:tetratricopeptide (TPR) repeat protein
VVDYREELGNVHDNYGLMLGDLSRHQDAEKVWRAALPLWRRLAEDLPERSGYRQKLARGCNELAIALCSLNRTGEVEAFWQEAISLQEQLVAEQPRDARAWQDLTGSCNNLVALLAALGQTPRLEQACRKWVDVLERRSKAFPGVKENDADLRRAYHTLAATLVRTNRLDDAMAILQRAADRGLNDKETLRTQSEWGSLRDRPDFKKLTE